MKQLFIRILYTLIAFGLILFFFLIYIGLFAEASTSTKELGPYTLVYKTHIGNYNRTGELITKVNESLEREYNIECTRAFAIFSNTSFLGKSKSQQKVNENELKSQVGCIINPEDEDKIKENFSLNNFDKQLFFIAEFPYKTKFSIMMATTATYPLLEKKIKENKYRKDFIMEIYDEDNSKIQFLLMPI